DLFFFLIISRPPTSTLFPYTTLFRSYLCMHRADLHDALVSAVPPEILHLNKRLTGLDQSSEQATLHFADNTRVHADAVVGADGRSEEHTSELQSLAYLVCRLLLEKKK